MAADHEFLEVTFPVAFNANEFVDPSARTSCGYQALLCVCSSVQVVEFLCPTLESTKPDLD